MVQQNQCTIQQVISIQGKALFTGREVSVKLVPAPVHSGIVFRRVDLPNSPEIPAQTEQVIEATRTTKIGAEEASVQTIEHIMAALYACGIDNLIVEIDGPEMPILDGSALPFLLKIEQAGIIEQEAAKEVYTVDAPLSYSKGDMYLVALPSDRFQVSYTLHYPQSPYLQSQYFTLHLTKDSFKEQIAPSRTFALYEEVSVLIQKGILKNAALEHGVVIDGEKVLNPEGVRFPDEMVRHKVLDLIGDIALLGSPLNVHFIGIKTGHAANHAIAKELRKSLRKQ